MAHMAAPTPRRAYLDFATDDAGWGGYVWLDSASFRAGVVGVGDHSLVALRDDAVPVGRDLDVRTDGLWASLTCETVGAHWSVGMEAFAVGYDDPVNALGDERGDRVALGFDLEWERDAAIWRVHGQVLVGDARIAVDAAGSLDHRRVTGRVGDEPFVTDDVIPVVGPTGLFVSGAAMAGERRAQLTPCWAAPIKDCGGIPRALCVVDADLGERGVAWVGG
jgi:hypothetical protein